MFRSTTDYRIVFFSNQMAPPQDIYDMKIQYVLTKTKDLMLHIINHDDLIFHRNKNKLKADDEVSWSGKARNNRGRGKIIIFGKFCN